TCTSSSPSIPERDGSWPTESRSTTPRATRSTCRRSGSPDGGRRHRIGPMVERGAPSSRPSGVLARWQRRLYRILLIPLGLIAANSIYLAAFTRDTAFFYAMLLLHLTLGLLIAIPFFVFAATHAKRMIRMWNKRAKYAGLAIFSLAIVCVSTGLFMVFQGATLNHRAAWLLHVASVPLALVAFILHRRAHTHQLQFRRLYAWG